MRKKILEWNICLDIFYKLMFINLKYLFIKLINIYYTNNSAITTTNITVGWCWWQTVKKRAAVDTPETK
jgi:hypothetical protein